MALAHLQQNDSAGNSAKALRRCAAAAAELEQFVEDARSVFTAIGAGGLLDRAPADPAAYNRHSAATTLLQMLETKLDQVAESLDRDSLSARLASLAATG